MNRKLRIAIAALAALTLAVAIAPMASAGTAPPTDLGEIVGVAPADDGIGVVERGKNAAKDKAAKAKACSDLKSLYDGNIEIAEDEAKKGADSDPKAVTDAYQHAGDAARSASNLGCSWAK